MTVATSQLVLLSQGALWDITYRDFAHYGLDVDVDDRWYCVWSEAELLAVLRRHRFPLVAVNRLGVWHQVKVLGWMLLDAEGAEVHVYDESEGRLKFDHG